MLMFFILVAFLCAGAFVFAIEQDNNLYVKPKDKKPSEMEEFIEESFRKTKAREEKYQALRDKQYKTWSEIKNRRTSSSIREDREDSSLDPIDIIEMISDAVESSQSDTCSDHSSSSSSHCDDSSSSSSYSSSDNSSSYSSSCDSSSSYDSGSSDW